MNDFHVHDKNRHFKGDFLIALIVVSTLSYLFVRLDVFDRLYQYTRLHESWELDEIIMIMVSVLVAGTLIALRHIFVLKKVIEELATANKKIEDQTRQQLQQEKMVSLGYMVGGLAHEINNAFQPLSGLGDLVRNGLEEAGNKKHLEYMDLILDRMKHAHTIVANIIDLCHDKPLKLSRVFAPTAIMDAVKSAIAMMPPHQVKFELPSSIDVARISCEIECNPVSVVQIFTNLIKNAIQAMHGVGIISVSIDIHNGATKMLVVRITDTGGGIDSQTIGKIFDPFYTTKDVSEGMGLGLFAVQRLMKRQNGVIAVESTLGQGTTFSVMFPVLPEIAT